jgi:hypothetical protein
MNVMVIQFDQSKELADFSVHLDREHDTEFYLGLDLVVSKSV